MLWTGTAASVVDLNPFLSGLGLSFIGSVAEGVSENGAIVGYVFDPNFNAYAVLWTPVPEPSSFAILTAALAVAPIFRFAPSLNDSTGYRHLCSSALAQ